MKVSIKLYLAIVDIPQNKMDLPHSPRTHCNRYVGPPVMNTPPRLSSVWFPLKQRTFATAVMVISQSAGLALGFIIVPYLTRHYDIHTMLYVTAEIAVFVALLATIYFPAHPPIPSSPSAGTERTEFLSSLKASACNKAFIVLAISGGLITGGNRSALAVDYNIELVTKMWDKLRQDSDHSMTER